MLGGKRKANGGEINLLLRQNGNLRRINRMKTSAFEGEDDNKAGRHVSSFYGTFRARGTVSMRESLFYCADIYCYSQGICQQ